MIHFLYLLPGLWEPHRFRGQSPSHSTSIGFCKVAGLKPPLTCTAPPGVGQSLLVRNFRATGWCSNLHLLHWARSTDFHSNYHTISSRLCCFWDPLNQSSHSHPDPSGLVKVEICSQPRYCRQGSKPLQTPEANNMATRQVPKMPQTPILTGLGQTNVFLEGPDNRNPHILDPKLGIPKIEIPGNSGPAQPNGMTVGLV
jgi:hypothetical protein